MDGGSLWLGVLGEVLKKLQGWEERLGAWAVGGRMLSQGPGPFFGGATPHFGEFFLFTVVDALQQVDPKTAAQVGWTWVV